MQESKAKVFLRNPFCRALVVSKRPMMREGLQFMMKERAEKSSLILCENYLDIRPEILLQIDVVVIELDSTLQEIFEACDFFNQLQNQHRQVEWVFTLPVNLVNIAIERLLTAKTALLSLHEPMSRIIEHVFNSGGQTERISRLLLQEKAVNTSDITVTNANLTFSERRVLRLLSKGWQLTQIATLLEKSYKTISAQKSSAMRRLMLKTDAEMYAWMISVHGMQELNLPPYHQGI
ncbi:MULTISPECIES: helix-turn-helix transcriptional regulator [Buttiauxella]|jgi:DNA-binding NarL/FixJ family response regulator|uniref:Regulator n=1 Tax=Buttiauxella ferragutiae ATCC 51602 TaxID=1354252 RepID=A0ABX2WA52_9ENTR|nr:MULTISPECIES: LuxR C-terminal-related transcriptional regulator [Buttiauxella]AYN28823.1 DNA-binding response regulator [Buttiauxella sp. 3AFRM03]MCE0825791.1 LuxR C-terminal-related transcriptional regulator [Buttiauxella ferragutiae]OAT29179.1 putative regulator [Buttiauxella ferragutiae ATCC 51602]TDN53149.1 DNA-binding NarL/FixJ family response regulator [Buttiauxella sp. JUb87]UNK61937.1 LuxR C-terminal-related transcriptional regulator [Buttiauxella ferragutiae]